jgi:transportin-3
MSHVLQKGVCERHGATSMDILKRILSCVASWLGNPLMPTDEFAVSPILRLLFEILVILRCYMIYRLCQISPSCPMEMHDAASDCLVAALYRVEDVDLHPQLAATLQTAVYGLVPVFELAVANEDQDR